MASVISKEGFQVYIETFYRMPCNFLIAVAIRILCRVILAGCDNGIISMNTLTLLKISEHRSPKVVK